MNTTMKRITIILIPAFIFLFSMTYVSGIEEFKFNGNLDIEKASKLEMPDNIKSILDKSCIACHNEDSKNTKGKLKLNFDKFNNGKYTKGKQIAKLNGIAKVLTKGKMPPKKFLEKYPEHALSVAESKMLIDWAKGQASALASE